MALRFLLPLLLLVQDGSVRDLIRQLEDENAEVRERAQKQLASRGDAAVAPLKEILDAAGASLELKARATTILREIDLAAKVSRVYKAPARVTLKAADTMLREVLDEVSRQASVVIDSGLVDPAAKVTVDLKDATLAQALDALCAGQLERSWEAQEDGQIRLTKERHPAMPAVYGDGFRVRVQSLTVERATDFKGKTVTLTATLAADWDKRLKPSKTVEIDLVKASDGTAAILDISAADAGMMVVRGVPGAQIRVAGMNFPEPGENTRQFSLKGLSPDAVKVDLEGTARFTFPLDYRDIKFDRPGTVESRDLGDTTVRIARGGASEIWTLSFHKNPAATTPSWSRTIAQRFDADSFTVVDVDGNEFTGSMRAPSLRGRQADVASEVGVWYQAAIPRNPSNAIKEVRFRFVDQTLVKSLPFKFTGLQLP